MPRAYFNENDKFCADWLRNLIAEGLIADGDVDDRSIRDVQPADLNGYTQVHLFAGIGIWSAALRLAGVPDSRKLWTASCPCQPFSAAGRGRGVDDDRHLWPEVLRLVRAHRPPVIFGEQVSSSIAVGKHARKPDERTHMQRLWERQAALRLCENRIQEDIEECLQELSKLGGSRVARREETFDRISRESAGSCGESEIGGEGPSVRSRSVLGSGGARSRRVFDDGLAVRPDSEARLEHAIVGQNKPETWLHPEQHAAGDFCVERGVRGLGREEILRDRLRSLRDAEEEVRRHFEVVGCEIAEADGSSWINSIQVDLEGAGYSGGALDSCSAGVGSPNIRQRLYFAFVEGLHDTTGARLNTPWSGPESASWYEARLRGSERGRGADFVEYAASYGRFERWAEPSGRSASGGCEPLRLADGRGAVRHEGPPSSAHSISGGLADEHGEQPGVRRGEEERAPRGGEGTARGQDRQRLRPEPERSGASGRLADSDGGRREGSRLSAEQEHGSDQSGATGSGEVVRLADSDDAERRSESTRGHVSDRPDARRAEGASDTEGRSGSRGLVDSNGERSERAGGAGRREDHGPAHDGAVGDGCQRPGPVNSVWRFADWLFCRDGRWRPVESGTFPLATGDTGRVGKLRAFGNALNLIAAREAVAAFLEAEADGFNPDCSRSVEDLIG